MSFEAIVVQVEKLKNINPTKAGVWFETESQIALRFGVVFESTWSIASGCGNGAIIIIYLFLK